MQIPVPATFQPCASRPSAIAIPSKLPSHCFPSFVFQTFLENGPAFNSNFGLDSNLSCSDVAISSAHWATAGMSLVLQWIQVCVLSICMLQCGMSAFLYVDANKSSARFCSSCASLFFEELQPMQSRSVVSDQVQKLPASTLSDTASTTDF